MIKEMIIDSVLILASMCFIIEAIIVGRDESAGYLAAFVITYGIVLYRSLK